jgi:hypothetical protein
VTDLAKREKWATSIDVWRSYHCDTPYSVSLCDDDGEIECLGGGDEDDAWALACEEADKRGLPARLLIGETQNARREYVPPEPPENEDPEAQS